MATVRNAVLSIDLIDALPGTLLQADMVDDIPFEKLLSFYSVNAKMRRIVLRAMLWCTFARILRLDAFGYRIFKREHTCKPRPSPQLSSKVPRRLVQALRNRKKLVFGDDDLRQSRPLVREICLACSQKKSEQALSRNLCVKIGRAHCAIGTQTSTIAVELFEKQYKKFKTATARGVDYRVQRYLTKGLVIPHIPYINRLGFAGQVPGMQGMPHVAMQRIEGTDTLMIAEGWDSGALRLSNGYHRFGLNCSAANASCTKVSSNITCLDFIRTTLLIGGKQAMAGCMRQFSRSISNRSLFGSSAPAHLKVAQLPGITPCSHIAGLELGASGEIEIDGIPCPKGIITIPEPSDDVSYLDLWIWNGDLYENTMRCLLSGLPKALDVYGARIACVTTMESIDHLIILSSYFPEGAVRPSEDHDNLAILYMTALEEPYEASLPVSVSVGLTDVSVCQHHVTLTFDFQSSHDDTMA